MDRRAAQGQRSLLQTYNLARVPQIALSASDNLPSYGKSVCRHMLFSLQFVVTSANQHRKSPQNWSDTHGIWLLISRIRTVCLSCRCSRQSQVSDPTFVSSEAGLHSSRPKATAPICSILSEPRSHHTCQVCALCGTSAQGSYPRFQRA
jgi:hypothetical protein